MPFLTKVVVRFSMINNVILRRGFEYTGPDIEGPKTQTVNNDEIFMLNKRCRVSSLLPRYKDNFLIRLIIH